MSKRELQHVGVEISKDTFGFGYRLHAQVDYSDGDERQTRHMTSGLEPDFSESLLDYTLKRVCRELKHSLEVTK